MRPALRKSLSFEGFFKKQHVSSIIKNDRNFTYINGNFIWQNSRPLGILFGLLVFEKYLKSIEEVNRKASTVFYERQFFKLSNFFKKHKAQYALLRLTELCKLNQCKR